MTEAVIIDGRRGPIGKFGGGLAAIRPDGLLATVYKAPMERRAVNPALLNDVYAGRGNQAGELGRGAHAGAPRRHGRFHLDRVDRGLSDAPAA